MIEVKYSLINPLLFLYIFQIYDLSFLKVHEISTNIIIQAKIATM